MTPEERARDALICRTQDLARRVAAAILAAEIEALEEAVAVFLVATDALDARQRIRDLIARRGAK